MVDITVTNCSLYIIYPVDQDTCGTLRRRAISTAKPTPTEGKRHSCVGPRPGEVPASYSPQLELSKERHELAHDQSPSSNRQPWRETGERTRRRRIPHETWQTNNELGVVKAIIARATVA